MRFDEPDGGASLTEQDIQSYVDGALDARLSDRVDDYLGQAPDEAQRVGFYHRLNARMQADFPSLEEPPASQQLQHALQSRWRRRVTRWSLGVLAGAVTLVGLLYTVRPVDLLTTAGVMALEEAAPAELASGAASASAGGAPLAAALDLSRVGFHATLSTTASLLVLFKAHETVYRNRSGDPVVLLSVPNWPMKAQPQWQAQRIGTIRVLSWTRDGMSYALVGQAKTRGLMLAADLATFSGAQLAAIKAPQ